MEFDELLDGEQVTEGTLRRRKLLPVWIKIFIWIFFVFLIIIPVAIVFGVMGLPLSLELYGLRSNAVFSLTGLLISASFLIKGFVSYGLWFEKDFGPDLAILDAILGVILCVTVMILSGGFPLRLELALLIPYLIKMIYIRPKWMKLKLNKNEPQNIV